MNCIELMLVFAMPKAITIFMFLEALCTLKDLKLMFSALQGLKKLVISEKLAYYEFTPETTRQWRVGGELHSFLEVVGSCWGSRGVVRGIFLLKPLKHQVSNVHYI
jgi:hypothetical protein